MWTQRVGIQRLFITTASLDIILALGNEYTL